jgi:hypothetical protein
MVGSSTSSALLLTAAAALMSLLACNPNSLSSLFLLSSSDVAGSAM